MGVNAATKNCLRVGGGGGGTTNDGHPTGWLHPKRGTLFRLQVYESVGISLLQLYESAGKSVISVCKKAQLC